MLPTQTPTFLASDFNVASAYERAEAFAASLRTQILAKEVPAIDPTLSILCADQSSSEILALDPYADWADPGSVRLRWAPLTAPEIPKAHRAWFENPSECKPLPDQRHALVTALNGGVALVDLHTQQAILHAFVGGNPHSAEHLPDGSIACACSTSNTIAIFPGCPTHQNTPHPEIFSTGLKDAHGIVWDDNRKILWAIGLESLIGSTYNFNTHAPQLQRHIEIDCPAFARHGHDLIAVPDTDFLLLTGVGVALFDREHHVFVLVTDTRNLKSISLYGTDENCALIIQKPTTHWWSDQICFLNRELTPVGKRPGARFYKGRWWKHPTCGI